ncbi:HNH endonuclease [Neptunicella sp. SCSIO 80796]|uniref:HNH endonuclease n=1 Tax=Neptunicella plasticusilytica TaxID=3117012 RepID=UPI003A4DF408
MSTNDIEIITTAFERVKTLSSLFGAAIPASIISEGFYFHGEKILLDNRAVGIFKPRQMQHCALSIKTTIRRDGLRGIYNDHQTSDNYFNYSLQRGDPYKNGNAYLWASLERNTPFIYFHAIAPGLYNAIWPCFVSNIFPDAGYALIAVGNKSIVKKDCDVQYRIPNEIESRYEVRETKIRMHQASFRRNVLDAYNNKCAITGLPTMKLLEAAHIIPDSQIGVNQTVKNGVSLSRLHHKAYDSNLIGIDSDYTICVSNELKVLDDNSFIKSSILDFEGKKLRVPQKSELRPDREYLAERFKNFLSQQ